MPPLNIDMALLNFGSVADDIAEKELKASFSGDEGTALMNTLYAEYKADGSPKQKRKWLRERLPTLFPCVGARPVWRQKYGVPSWPFYNGKPMLFVQQFDVPINDISVHYKVATQTVYVFSALEPSTARVNGRLEEVHKIIYSLEWQWPDTNIYPKGEEPG